MVSPHAMLRCILPRMARVSKLFPVVCWGTMYIGARARFLLANAHKGLNYISLAGPGKLFESELHVCKE